VQQAKHSELVATLQTVAATRLDELEAELSRLTSERAEMDSQITRLAEEGTQLRGLLATYGQKTPVTPATLSIVRHDKSPADHVVDLLSAEARPMHFREIEQQIRARGLYAGSGQDPANALLAHYFNDPRLYRPARGTYAVRPADRIVKSVGTKRARRA
jgi:HB1, ASXL, restriction endonuclease HTH domain